MSGFAQPKAFAAGALSGNAGFFSGYTLRETAGAAATVRLWDNATQASGTLLATIALAANASKDFSANDPVRFANGIWAEVVAGAVEGSIFIR